MPIISTQINIRKSSLYATRSTIAYPGFSSEQKRHKEEHIRPMYNYISSVSKFPAHIPEVIANAISNYQAEIAERRVTTSIGLRTGAGIL